ncbi:MAG: site-specific DNA-methyltransferase (adenine-specific) [Oleiphilaceae bacterium]|jgi:site-specific DNA-methyltransferase (adenine-specific)
MYQLISGDSFTSLQSMDDASVDLILTDPPYESLEKHRAVGTTTRLKKDWFPVISNAKLVQYINECFRVLKDNSHCYIMSDQETHYVIRNAAIAAGFTWKKFIVWDKECIGMGYSYRAKHEVISFISKGYRKLNDLSLPDVLSHKRVHNGYPTEKPVKLSEDIIRNASNEGETVLDMFAGSGSTMEASLNLNRNVIGMELCSETCLDIRLRLNQHKEVDNLLIQRKQLALAL